MWLAARRESCLCRASVKRCRRGGKTEHPYLLNTLRSRFQPHVHASATGRHICSRCSLCWSASLELGPAAARAVVVVVAGSVGLVAVAGPAVEAARQNGIGAPT